MYALDWSPLWLSLKTAVCTTLIVFLLGLGAAWQTGRLPARRQLFWDSIFTLPLVLPPTVTGFFLLWLFGTNGPLGRLCRELLGFSFAFTWAGTVLAAAVIAFPLLYRSARAALEQVDPDLAAAARTLGMGEAAIFRKVLLPNALGGLIAGAVLAFARSLGEFGATVMLAGNIAGLTRTLPLAIYSSVAAGRWQEAAFYAGAAALLGLAAVFFLNLFLYRSSRKRES